jgi:hypothetical protein
MKHINKILLMTLVFSGLCVKGQNNLIHNAVIEQPVNEDTPFYPGLVDNRTVKYYTYSGGWQTTNLGNQGGLSVWEDDIKVITTVLTGSGQLPEKVDLLLHSPEWFMTNTYASLKKIRVVEDNVNIVPHSGIGYLGMGPGELVQQKFFNANKFKEGEKYTLNFYIRPIKDQNSYADSDKIGAQGYGGDWSDGLDLKVYLRKNKMKYSSAANNKNNRCDPSKFYKKQSTNNTITVINHHVTLASYPTGQWYPVTVEFTAPASNYDWIVIETQSTKLCNSPYLLLDDFLLTKSCEFPSCDRTGGDVFPHHNGIVTNTVPLTVTNLNNAQSVTLEIFTVLGQPIWSYSVSCINGIQNPIYWDGRTSSGSYAANATYLLKTTYTNDCGKTSKTSAFVKNGNYSPIINNNIVCNTSGVETPVPCCVYAPDIVVDNITLPGLGLLDYRVLNKITVAPTGNVNVTSNADVEMRAGYEIIINPGFSTDIGAHYLAEIVPCTNSGRLRPSDVDPVEFSMEKEESITIVKNEPKQTVEVPFNEEILDKDLIVNVSPNPSSNGNFYLDITNNSSQSYIEVFDLMGTFISTEKLGLKNRLKIDLSNYPKGIYLIRLIDGDKTLTKKIIYN